MVGAVVGVVIESIVVVVVGMAVTIAVAVPVVVDEGVIVALAVSVIPNDGVGTVLEDVDGSTLTSVSADGRRLSAASTSTDCDGSAVIMMPAEDGSTLTSVASIGRRLSTVPASNDADGYAVMVTSPATLKISKTNMNVRKILILLHNGKNFNEGTV